MSIEDENLGSTVLERLTEAIEELSEDDAFVERTLAAADAEFTRENTSKVRRIIRDVAEHVASEYSL